MSRRRSDPAPVQLSMRRVYTSLGVMDGMWTPLTRSLPGELHGLIPVVFEALGHVARVKYRIDDWGLCDDVLVVGSRSVLLEGFWRPRHPSVTLFGKDDKMHLAIVLPASAHVHVTHDVARSV